MSILLSAYFPEGIVFAADRNVTIYDPNSGLQDIEVGAITKVVPWAYRKAVVGYCGLGQLAGLGIDEWMRQFAAYTRDFNDLASLAAQMKELVQQDFDQDHPEGTNVGDCGLIVHLGGFRYEDDIAVPAMYYFSNVPSFDKRGEYFEAVRHFTEPEDHLEMIASEHGVKNPADYRPWLEQMYQDGQLVWFNNGFRFVAFNVFKGILWAALTEIRKHQIIPLRATPSLSDRVAYCAMAVDMYGSFFFHHYKPRFRPVGGGADAEYVPWPETG